MGKVNYSIKIEYENQDLKNIMLQIFEEYCAKKILEKIQVTIYNFTFFSYNVKYEWLSKRYREGGKIAEVRQHI